MPQYTSNMNLYKVDLETDGNSTFNIMTMLNDNWDKIDSNYDEQEGRIRGNSEVVNEVKEDVGDKSELKTEDKSSLVGAVNEVSSGMADIAYVIVASGTGTTITLSMPSVTAYTDNMKLTFIASADNSGGDTTIDINSLGAKNLYKPNTTTAPNLKSGKSYTVWYDGTNFFLQASAEGNAVAGDVLAGKTFSNDDDTGILGTMDLSNLIPSNIRQGININSVIGTLIQGKRQAMGTLTISGVYNPDIRGLSFVPRYVMVYMTSLSSNEYIYVQLLSRDNDINVYGGGSNTRKDSMYGRGAIGGSSGEVGASYSVFYNDGFQIQSSGTNGMQLKWIAME